jgi:hypothetical protein
MVGSAPKTKKSKYGVRRATKGVIIIRKSKDRHHNGQREKQRPLILTQRQNMIFHLPYQRQKII